MVNFIERILGLLIMGSVVVLMQGYAWYKLIKVRWYRRRRTLKWEEFKRLIELQMAVGDYRGVYLDGAFDICHDNPTFADIVKRTAGFVQGCDDNPQKSITGWDYVKHDFTGEWGDRVCRAYKEAQCQKES